MVHEEIRCYLKEDQSEFLEKHRVQALTKILLLTVCYVKEGQPESKFSGHRVKGYCKAEIILRIPTVYWPRSSDKVHRWRFWRERWCVWKSWRG